MSLGKLLSILSHYHRKMAVDWRLPAECFIQKNMERTGRDPFLGPHDMCDSHHMVIDHVGQMICREAIALEKDWIWRYILVLSCDVTHEHIVESCLSLCRHTESDYRLDALGFQVSPLFICKVCAMSVVTLIFALGCNLLLSHLFKSFRCAVAVIGLSVPYKLLGIFLVDIKAFRLDVGAIGSSNHRTFVPFDSKPVQSIIEILEGLV